MDAGASSGIGREVALECARRGARLVLGCRDGGKAEAVSAHIKRKTGNDDIHYVIVDLASLASVRQLVETCCRREWIVDVLINNAGLSILLYSIVSPVGLRSIVMCLSVCLSVICLRAYLRIRTSTFHIQFSLRFASTWHGGTVLLRWRCCTYV